MSAVAVIAKTHNAARWMRKQCTCEVCRLAASEQQALSHRRRRERLLADPTLRPHGEVNTLPELGLPLRRVCRCLGGAHEYESDGVEQTTRHSRTQPFGREWINDQTTTGMAD